MFGLFGQKSKALQLIRDSQSIIRSDETAYADRHLLKISEIASSSIRRALNKSVIKNDGNKKPTAMQENAMTRLHSVVQLWQLFF